ncbi:hypothetical protein J7L60_05585 [Candidatus Bathyarchaeota archaeon]|nr:hypothetical protein [Candidatus Bathyarchaeota archaeon]
MTRSYIKIYGPPIVKALRALEQVAVEMSKKTTIRVFDVLIPPYSPPLEMPEYGATVFPHIELSAEEKVKLISKASQTLGEYDFFFEWGEEPTIEQVTELIEKIDEALAKCGCKYTITTK